MWSFLYENLPKLAKYINSIGVGPCEKKLAWSKVAREGAITHHKSKKNSSEVPPWSSINGRPHHEESSEWPQQQK